MSRAVGRLGNVILGVDDIGEACAFYQDTLGLALKFRDGDRWAAFDAGGVTLAIAAGSEKPVGSAMAISFKVDDVKDTLRTALAGGARLIADVIEGRHERRATVQDRNGHLIHFYSPAVKKP